MKRHRRTASLLMVVAPVLALVGAFRGWERAQSEALGRPAWQS